MCIRLYPFPGLRGAIAFALSLHMNFNDELLRRIMITTTLILVVFTIVVLGGCTMPVMKVCKILSCCSSRGYFAICTIEYR